MLTTRDWLKSEYANLKNPQEAGLNWSLFRNYQGYTRLTCLNPLHGHSCWYFRSIKGNTFATGLLLLLLPLPAHCTALSCWGSAAVLRLNSHKPSQQRGATATGGTGSCQGQPVSHRSQPQDYLPDQEAFVALGGQGAPREQHGGTRE